MGRAKHKTGVQYYHMLVLWRKGISMNQIAKQLEFSYTQVKNAIKRFQTGIVSEHHGRTRKTTPRKDWQIALEVKRDPFITVPRMKDKLDVKLSKKISHTTLKCRL